MSRTAGTTSTVAPATSILVRREHSVGINVLRREGEVEILLVT